MRRAAARGGLAPGATRALLALLGAALGAGAPLRDAHAQAVPGVSRRDSLVEFDFQDADVRVVISALAQVAGINVVYTNLPARTVTLRTSGPVPVSSVRQYLASVVRANNLTLTDEGGLVRIAGDSAAAAARQPAVVTQTTERPGSGVRLHVYRLRHTKAEVLSGTISELFGIGRGVARDAGRSLTDELRRQRVPTFDPDAALQGDVAGAGRETGGERGGDRALSTALGGPVQIVADPNTNALLIRATAGDYETLRAAIVELDVRPLQVLIEVLVAEVRRNRQAGLGVNLSVPVQSTGEGRPDVGGELGSVSAGDLTLRALRIGPIDASATLRALAASGTVSILSRPVVLAQNNQEARILVGSQRPFIQLFRALPTDAAVRDQVVQYRDVGTRLTIQPTINPDGYVSLSVLQEVSSATAEVQFGAPVISTRELRTQLLVRDGQTIVLGGLMDQQRTRTRSGIPLLKDIPVLGWLFGSTQLSNDVTELFLFLTPRIIRTDEDIDDATRRLRESTGQIRKLVPPGSRLLPAARPPASADTAAPAPPPGAAPDRPPEE